MADSPGLPADITPGMPTGIGLKPSLEEVMQDAPHILPPRPVRARANDASRPGGIVAEGNCGGETNTERDIPWL